MNAMIASIRLSLSSVLDVCVVRQYSRISRGRDKEDITGLDEHGNGHRIDRTRILDRAWLVLRRTQPRVQHQARSVSTL